MTELRDAQRAAEAMARRSWGLGLVGLAAVACTSFGGDPAPPDAGTTPVDGGASSTDASIGNGNGRGRQTLAGDPPNRFGSIVAASPAASRTVRLDQPEIVVAGGVVLVWQVTTADVPRLATRSFPPGDSTGRYDFFRVVKTTGNEVELDRELGFDVAASGAQLVTVPEYGDVTVAAGSTLRPPPWDGRTGGIFVILASGTVTLEGNVDVAGAGFRGGPGDPDESAYGCQKGDGLPAEGYAPKGEGIASLRFAATSAPRSETNGPFAYGNGGGGGACHNAGGAGGGHGGAGGRGGDAFSAAGTSRAAEPGGSLKYSPRERLFFGGGGGAGERNDSPTSGGGGRGGGVVLIRGDVIEGSGAVSATGLAGTYNRDDSGSGGGAGGLAILDATGRLGCFAVDVGGGKGGDGDGGGGPGGGGGAGIIGVAGLRDRCDLRRGVPGNPGLALGSSKNASAGEKSDPIVSLIPR